ncbi:MAG: TetR/AcrR family transcriptional regulator, partial [Pseudorhodoplanes sp.]
WDRGYEATSMQDLVDHTGINRGSLYATFGDKHALFIAALRRYDESRRVDTLAELEARFAPRDAIRELFLSFSDQASERGKNRGCFMTNTALELAAHDAQVGKIVAHSQEQIEKFFARMIESGKERGEIPTHVNATGVSRGLLASLIGLVVLTRSRPQKPLLKAIVDDAMRKLE